LLESSTQPISVWHAASSSAGPGPLERRCETWLDPSEQERADRFRQPTSRNQHVVGRGMAKRLLSSGSGVDPKSICFAAEAHGKPYVTEPDSARRPFNIAHTDGLVMCGIGGEGQVAIGVDVERLNRRTDPGLADRYFSKPEVQFLQSFRRDQERRSLFLRIWTLKESFIKAIGTGLQTPLADFAFEQIESSSPTIRMLDPKLESDWSWKFYSIEPESLRRTQGVAVLTPTDAETVSLGIRFDLRTSRKLTCRIRFAGRLDPSMPWQVVSISMLERFANQLIDQAAMVSAEAARLDRVYDLAGTADRRILRVKRDRNDTLGEMIASTTQRVGELQKLIAQLEAEGALKIRIWVEWPTMQQDLLTMEEGMENGE